MQDHVKDQIKNWLKQQRQPREWLASQCGVTKRTVDNWLSSPQPIPDKAVLIIEKLMASSEGGASLEEAEIIPLIVRVDEHRFEAYNRASMAEGMTIREWMICALDAAAEVELADDYAARHPQEDEEDPVADAVRQVMEEKKEKQ